MQLAYLLGTEFQDQIDVIVILPVTEQLDDVRVIEPSHDTDFALCALRDSLRLESTLGDDFDCHHLLRATQSTVLGHWLGAEYHGKATLAQKVHQVVSCTTNDQAL